MPCNYNPLTRNMRLMALIILMILYVHIPCYYHHNQFQGRLTSTGHVGILKCPQLELELKSPELKLELKLIVSCGIGIEKNGIGIALKKWNWPQTWFSVILKSWIGWGSYWGVCRSQGSLFEPRFLSQGCIFVKNSLAKGICFLWSP